MSKRPLIFFSGGLDSTALLQHRRIDVGNVDVVYANGGQCPIKAYAEKQAREKIIAYLHKHSPHRVIEQYEVEPIEQLGGIGNGLMTAKSNLWVQPLAWFLAALYTVQTNVHSAVEVGVVLGDQAASTCKDLAQAWNLLGNAAIPGVGLPSLTYPISHWTKQSVIGSMTKELRELTWTCEAPLWDNNAPVACGTCRPCRTMALEMAIWNESGKLDPLGPARQLGRLNLKRFLDGKRPLKSLPKVNKDDTISP